MMNLVDITQQFGDKLLYEKINAQINKGEHVGLIGRNGAGKSTLIKIITGEILPDEGQVVVSPKFHVGYLDQYVNVDETMTIQEFLQTAFAEDLAKEVEITKLYEDYATDMDDRLLERAGRLQNELDQGDFYQMNTLIDELATGLGIHILGMDSVLKNLSGGQRSKILLAKLLLEKPDLLILDEPTNHLDDDHVQWLTQFLKEFPGTFLVVSHDHAFLNEVTTHIMDIEFGQLTKYTGNLEKATKQKELRAETYMRQYEAQQTHIKKTEEYIRKYKAGSRSTMAKSREKQLAKIERLTPPADSPTPNIVFEPIPLVTTLALETDDLLVGYDKPLLAPLKLTVRYGEKVALRGFNGIGKSTLIKTLIGEIPALGGSFHFPNHTKINYFSQELAWENPLETPFQYLSNRYPKANNKELRRQLSRSGLSSELAQQSLKTLSGGEQTKVKLADMTMIKSNFLILDEPTNHIDKVTKENLQKALEQFPGTVVVVSHENTFYEDFVDRVISLGEQKISLWTKVYMLIFFS